MGIVLGQKQRGKQIQKVPNLEQTVMPRVVLISNLVIAISKVEESKDLLKT